MTIARLFGLNYANAVIKRQAVTLCLCTLLNLSAWSVRARRKIGMIMRKLEAQQQKQLEPETTTLKELVNPVDNYDNLFNQYPDYEQSYIFDPPPPKSS